MTQKRRAKLGVIDVGSAKPQRVMELGRRGYERWQQSDMRPQVQKNQILRRLGLAKAPQRNLFS